VPQNTFVGVETTPVIGAGATIIVAEELELQGFWPTE
jgi:hypothetical protein